jgi:signal transduction histidine kinase
MIALVVVMAAFGDAGFAVSGAGLVLLASATVFASAGIAFLYWNTAGRPAALALFVLMGAALVAGYAVDFTSTVVGLFLLGAFAALREPRSLIALALVLVLVAHNGVQVSAGHDSVLSALATDAGVAFFLLLGRLLVAERRQREQVAALLAEIEAGKRAERAASVTAERGRMARELHDVLAHTLSGLALHLEAARLLASQPGTNPALHDAVDDAHRLAKAGLQEARRAVGALRGEELPGAALLPQLVDEHRLSARGGSAFTVSGEPVALVPEAELALYRAAQEALSNVRKHAPAASVEVELRWEDDRVVLAVEDVGGRRAEEPPDPGEPGSGLTGMAERSTLLGGTLDTGPTDTGYRVRLTIPYESNLRDSRHPA